MVASSNARLNPAQRALLNSNEVPIKNLDLGANSNVKIHAEQKITQYAAQNGITVQQIAATRPICQGCATAINNAGGVALTPVKLPLQTAVAASTYVKPPLQTKVPTPQQ
jgi:hypothetical protein